MVSCSVLAGARRWSHFADFVSRIMCMRLFIAVLFDDSVLDRCAALRDRLHDASRGGSFVERDKLHLTLEFLGECPQSSLARLTSVLDDLDFTPFDIRISSLGRFRRKDGDIWWLGTDHSDRLESLQHRLHSMLLDAGIRLEDRPYRPHITLARRVQCIADVPQVTPFCARAGNVSLIESVRTGHGFEYRPLYSV